MITTATLQIESLEVERAKIGESEGPRSGSRLHWVYNLEQAVVGQDPEGDPLLIIRTRTDCRESGDPPLLKATFHHAFVCRLEQAITPGDRLATHTGVKAALVELAELLPFEFARSISNALDLVGFSLGS